MPAVSSGTCPLTSTVLEASAVTNAPRALALTPWELASGTAIGADDASPALPAAGRETEREALVEALLPALSRSPCVVSFSGGLDSSSVLALAVQVARENGLPDPIPVSLRFPGVRSTEESAWQELVVSHLKLADWQRVEIGGELDFLGATARAALAEHGLLWPANAHFHAPVFAYAAGGSVLTGLDGDGLFRGWRWQRARTVLAHPATAEPRDALRVLLALGPSPLRAATVFARATDSRSWLRPVATWRLRAILAVEAGTEPSRWDARVQWYVRRRYLRLGVHSLALLANAHDVRVLHPFLDPRLLATFAARGGRAGYGSRGEAMRALLGDLLPRELFGRRTKAEFGRALWGEEARAFARGWDGRGLDDDLIDPEALAGVWEAENPPLAAATLLQAAWLAARVRPPPSDRNVYARKAPGYDRQPQ
ncbi:MAG TPA: asparagine synthase-related protein [Solirubrobacteraceae bacterium]|jgi:asparagine synthase (glutamine-hydrolysing)|nr:asparagine synthase-related protein [Solirubrobacteraceae bacterium]